MSSKESVFSSKRVKRSFSVLLRLFRRFRMRSEAQRRCNVEEATHLVGGVLGGGLEERLKFLMKNQGHKDRCFASFGLKKHLEMLVSFELFYTELNLAQW